MNILSQKRRRRSLITKTLVTFYRGYKIYKIVDARKNVFYNANSDHITEGFVSVVADTMEETHLKIDKIYQRRALLAILDRSRG